MAQSAAPDRSEDDAKDDSERTPTWVKVFGSILVILVLLFVILHLSGVIGRHGPGLH